MKKKSAFSVKNIIKMMGPEQLVIIALCGIALIVLSVPTKKQGNTKNRKVVTQENVAADYCTYTEQKIRNMIVKINGITDAQVYLTLKSGREDVVLKESSGEREEVVYGRDETGGQTPYVIKENEPEIEGIAVIVKGDASPENILKITNMLLALFHIESHKISVIGI